MGFVSVKITIVLQEVNPYEYEIEARSDSDVNDVKHAQAEVTKATAIQTPPPKHFIGQRITCQEKFRLYRFSLEKSEKWTRLQQ